MTLKCGSPASSNSHGNTDVATNIDAFNSITVDLLGMLYRLHPRKADFSPADLSEASIALIAEVAPGARPPIWWLTALWLETEGYIRIGFKPMSGEHVGHIDLTSKGFAALASVPASLEGKAPLGDRIAAVASTAGGEVRSAAIGSIVGAFVAAATKQVLG